MSDEIDSATPTFKQQEQAGWDTKAKYYDDHAGGITREAVQSLLAVADIKAGTTLLDVACGPGYIAGYATKQEALAIGVDFAPGMIVEAKKNFSDTEFREGDAEKLAFENGSFDVVICAFGLLHLADPDMAIAEAYRVLKLGGRYVFTVWSLPEKHDFFRLVLNAIEAHGTLEVSLPEAPPIFRFSKSSECKNVLTAAGFTNIEVTELPLHWTPSSPQDLLNFLDKSSVRTAMLLEKQTPDALTRIHQSILDGAKQFKHGNAYRLEWPAVLTVARKPL